MMDLQLNGKIVRIPDDQHDEPLVWVLHDTLQLNGTRYGCGAGFCGCCTVLIDGQPARACQTKASDVGSKSLRTLEGLAQDAKLHPVQQAFLDNPLQCCYCMSGHIMTAVALLEKNPNPTDSEIDDAMTINLCRCGGYNAIRANVKRAAAIKRGAA
jgi:aerobic-type carbon monoxide dehydrogenase small subunit (CoxS/CutS family)